MVVIVIIVVLVTLLIPAVALVHTKANVAHTRAQVAGLMIATRAYADEDSRHFFPTPKAGSEQLLYDLTDPNSTLMLLERSGYQVTTSEVDNRQGATCHALMDGWWRAMHYRIDGPFIKADGRIDSTGMNGTADKPAPFDDWNSKNIEPFAYIWSLGRPHSNDTTDALLANDGSWIYYQQGTP